MVDVVPGVDKVLVVMDDGLHVTVGGLGVVTVDSTGGVDILQKEYRIKSCPLCCKLWREYFLLALLLLQQS